MADQLYCPWISGAPCFKPEVWAAWWQAFLAALAIWWAVRIASSSTRKERSRKVDVYVQLIEMASDLVENAIAKATDTKTVSVSFESINWGELKQITSSLRDITLHDAPDYRLLPIILRTAKICEELEQRVQVIATSSDDAVTGTHSANIKIDGVGIKLLSFEARTVGAEYKDSIFPRLAAIVLRKRLGMKR